MWKAIAPIYLTVTVAASSSTFRICTPEDDQPTRLSRHYRHSRDPHFSPLPRRKIALINDEAIRENGDEDLNLAGIVDISDEKQPLDLAFFPAGAAAGKRIEELLRKGGRFGPHNHTIHHQACRRTATTSPI